MKDTRKRSIKTRMEENQRTKGKRGDDEAEMQRRQKKKIEEERKRK